MRDLGQSFFRKSAEAPEEHKEEYEWFIVGKDVVEGQESAPPNSSIKYSVVMARASTVKTPGCVTHSVSNSAVPAQSVPIADTLRIRI